ncbi:FAD-dependent oxidoreductase [Novipirellula rosea]|uniref:FAD-dependent oxidoreductase n=1 Tax=Novipirellula rosea TaxID=1031540 RepID=A0ABP8MYS6_9BACT
MNPHCIALLGIGHTNAEVVRRWIDSPIPNCRLVCISKFPFTTYSGMLPGTLANQFSIDEMQIPLGPLAEKAGAELILDECIGLDVETQTLRFANHAPLTFDALSIGIGSMPAGWDQHESPSIVPIKPMQTFIERFSQRVVQCQDTANRPPKIVVVGGGVAGVEIAFCVHTRLKHLFPKQPVSIEIVTSGDEIADGLSPHSVQRLRDLLARRSIGVTTDFRVVEVNQDEVVDPHGNRQPADVVLWATGAAAPPLLGKLNLPTDDRGFLATEQTLRTTADGPIFAVGDSGTILSDPAPKAGVFAVRQAPVLWKNLHATINATTLSCFTPQKEFLKILNTGDGRALLQYKGYSFHASWCWQLKRWIDERFIQQYQF